MALKFSSSSLSFSKRSLSAFLSEIFSLMLSSLKRIFLSSSSICRPFTSRLLIFCQILNSWNSGEDRRSSPLFQEFKIWQNINNLEVNGRQIELDDKKILFNELSIKEKVSDRNALKLLFENDKELELNFKAIEGNRTQAKLFSAYQRIISLSGHGEYDFDKMPTNDIMEIVEKVFNGLGYNTKILHFDSNLPDPAFEEQPAYKLWHLLYSFEGDNSKTGNEKLIAKISELCGFEKEYAAIIARLTFEPDYGSLSAKAIRKILPSLKEGNDYSQARSEEH